MLKFVSILVTLAFIEPGKTLSENSSQINEVKVEFSESAIGIESGQPIFSKGTKVWVSNPTETQIDLFINDEEKSMKEKKIEISNLTAGTYTIMIVNANKTDEKRTVGFTIQ